MLEMLLLSYLKLWCDNFYEVPWIHKFTFLQHNCTTFCDMLRQHNGSQHKVIVYSTLLQNVKIGILPSSRNKTQGGQST